MIPPSWANLGPKTPAYAVLASLAAADRAVQADAPVLYPLPPDAPDDASAALAGVPVGGIYRNSSILMLRTT